jgi:hypothetical protein
VLLHPSWRLRQKAFRPRIANRRFLIRHLVILMKLPGNDRGYRRREAASFTKRAFIRLLRSEVNENQSLIEACRFPNFENDRYGSSIPKMRGGVNSWHRVLKRLDELRFACRCGKVVGAAIVSCWAFRRVNRTCRANHDAGGTSHNIASSKSVLDTLGLLPSLPFVGDASYLRREATVRCASHPGHAADPHPVPKQLPRQLHRVTPAP